MSDQRYGRPTPHCSPGSSIQPGALLPPESAAATVACGPHLIGMRLGSNSGDRPRIAHEPSVLLRSPAPPRAAKESPDPPQPSAAATWSARFLHTQQKERIRPRFACGSGGDNCAVHRSEDRARVVEEHLTGREKRHPFRRANEELRSDLALERSDLPTDGRLCHVEALCGASDIALLGDGNEVAYLGEAHVYDCAEHTGVDQDSEAAGARPKRYWTSAPIRSTKLRWRSSCGAPTRSISCGEPDGSPL